MSSKKKTPATSKLSAGPSTIPSSAKRGAVPTATTAPATPAPAPVPAPTPTPSPAPSPAPTPAPKVIPNDEFDWLLGMTEEVTNHGLGNPSAAEVEAVRQKLGILTRRAEKAITDYPDTDPATINTIRANIKSAQVAYDALVATSGTASANPAAGTPVAGQPATTGTALTNPAGGTPPVGQPAAGQPAATPVPTTPWYRRYGKRIVILGFLVLIGSLLTWCWFFLKPVLLARMAAHNTPPTVATDTNMVAIVNALQQQLAAVQESLRYATNQVQVTPPTQSAPTNVTTAPAPQRTETKVNAKENAGGVWTGNTFNFPQAQKVEEAKEALKQLSNLDSKVTSRPQWCTNVTYLPPNTLVDHTCNYTNRGTVGPGDFVIIDPPSGWAANYWVSDPNSLESRQEGLPASLSLGREPAPYAGKENATFWLKPGASPVTYEVTFYRYR